ncbi:MAG: heat-inducible transcription repressor HrcA [Actinobacteria bacterium HGW-Actinobacteria-7]|jgi:heat-inducible transcriptional repressor|nr:MAG: heat-inducible transcription repressor HrcA [Actinobacteria bacterium HGW-Actinobacteria-7]
MLNERRRRVLQALVEEYIVSATPVGSKTLVSRYDLGCSPATVRSELSILEETGYVAQPHVSAGRIPTDTGYRSFVDELLERRNAETDAAITAPLHRAAEIDDLMRETSAALTRLTNCLAITVAPSVSTARVKRLDLLSMSPRRALFVLITESGQVVNRSIELTSEASPEEVSEIERALNAGLSGKRATEILPLRDAVSTAASDPHDPRGPSELTKRVLDEILDALGEADRDRLFHVGVPALLSQPEFHDAERARPLIEFLEDGIAVLGALSEALDNRALAVRIGHENRRAELGNLSIVATNYGTGSADGFLGVIGPTRMDYGRAISAVRIVADELEDALG